MATVVAVAVDSSVVGSPSVEWILPAFPMGPSVVT